jgi:hypothetical protein
MLVDVAQMMEVTKYIPTAESKMGLRPHMSESLAHTGAAAAFASR